MLEASAPGRDVLRVNELNAWYGESHILHGMSLDVGEGETQA